MAAVPLKPAYRPTLGQLLAPRWRRLPAVLRPPLVALGLALLAGVLGLVLALLPPHLSHRRGVAFHFDYPGLYRTVPDPGGYVKVVRHRHRQLEDSFAVEPLTLPPYRGSLTAELPLYAASYIPQLARQDPGFELRGEGKTRVNTVPAYNIFYTTRFQGRVMWGRRVLLLPPQPPRVRRGVVIVLLTSPRAAPQVKSVLEVATAGVLQTPLHTLTLG